MKKRKTINELYIRARGLDTPLLSNYDGNWWNDYVTNYKKYDSVFNRLYYSFEYFLQDGDEDLDTVLDNFKTEVKNFLLLHDKEFSELYKVKVLANNSYNLTENYKITETMDRDNTYDKGSRSDSNSNTIGSQNNTITDKVSPYDNENFYNDNDRIQSLGQRSDSGSYTSGSQHDASTEDYTKTTHGYNGNPTNIINNHVKFWSSFDFYSYVFGMICEELLMIGKLQ